MLVDTGPWLVWVTWPLLKTPPRTCTKTMGLPIPAPPVMLSKVETDHFSTYTQYVEVDWNKKLRPKDLPPKHKRMFENHHTLKSLKIGHFIHTVLLLLASSTLSCFDGFSSVFQFSKVILNLYHVGYSQKNKWQKCEGFISIKINWNYNIKEVEIGCIGCAI